MTEKWLARHNNAGSINAIGLELVEKINGVFTDNLQKPSIPVAISELRFEEPPNCQSFEDLSNTTSSRYRTFAAGEILFFVSADLIALLSELRLGMPWSLVKQSGDQPVQATDVQPVSSLELSFAGPALQSIFGAWLSAFKQTAKVKKPQSGTITDLGWGTKSIVSFKPDDGFFLSDLRLHNVEKAIRIAVKSDVLSESDQSSKPNHHKKNLNEFSSDHRNLFMNLSIPIEIIIFSTKTNVQFLNSLRPGRIIPLNCRELDQVSATVLSKNETITLFTGSLGRIYDYKAIRSSGPLK